MPKVSAIIPVYNTEKYLEKCLDSVCNQTLSDIEIICIDDCSTDGSLEILKDYAQKDNRIKLIEFKENKGAAAARNEGIKAATGEYIGFIDSDDYPETELFYEHLYNNAKEKDADISKGAYKDSETGYIDETINAKILENKNNFCSTYCSAIFRNDFIKGNSIKFPELRDMEDPVFAFNCALKANKVEIVPECNLIITKREDSITAKIPTFEQIKDKIKGLEIIFDLDVHKKVPQVLSYWFATVIMDSLCNKNLRIEEYVLYKCADLYKTMQNNQTFRDELNKSDRTLSVFFDSYKIQTPFLPKEIKKEIDKYDIISFDIFDTLLIRPFLKPTDLFDFLGFIKKDFDFSALRQLAEKMTRIRKTFKEKYSEDITYDEIYENIKPSKKSFKNFELEMETRTLNANFEMKEIYEYALKKNKKIIITSDMYMRREFLENILIKNGFEGFSKLYVSGEVQKTKGSGNLFDFIIEDLKIKPNKLLHIGDNEYSDYKVPKERGINAILYSSLIDIFKSNFSNNKIINFTKTNKDIETQVFAGLLFYNSSNIKNDNYWYNFGYCYGGIIILAFVNEIIKIAKERNLSDLFFIARDAFVLKEVFDLFAMNLNIKTHYIYAQRKIASKCQKKSSEYCTKTENEYKKYINGIELAGDNIGIVDSCAGNFTAQSLIEKYLQNKKIVGIYLVTNLNYRYNYINLLSHSGSDVMFNWNLMELLLTSPELPIVDIENSNPIYSKKPDKIEFKRQEIYKHIYQGEMDFIKIYQNLFENDFIENKLHIAYEFLCNYWNHLSQTDRLMLSKLSHPMDISSTEYLSLLIDPCLRNKISKGLIKS